MPYRALTHGRVKRHIKGSTNTNPDNATQKKISNSSKGLENSGSVISTRNRADVFSGGRNLNLNQVVEPKVVIRNKNGNIATMLDFRKKNSQGKGKRALANPMPSVGEMSRFAKRAIQRRTNLSTKICCNGLISSSPCLRPCSSINLKQIKDHDYRLKKNDGTMDFAPNTLIVTADTSTYNPNWYGATTILNWNKNLKIPTKGTHIVRDSRFKDGNGNVKATLDPYIIKEYLSLMGGDICQWVPFHSALYIRQSQSPNRYWLSPVNTSWEYIIYYNDFKIQELFGVDNHESIKKPHR